MNSPPYVFTVDNVAEIRSELSITILVKKNERNFRLKIDAVTFLNRSVGLQFGKLENKRYSQSLWRKQLAARVY